MSDPNAGLERLNALPDAEARALLMTWCGSKKWAERIAAARPFASVDELLGQCDQVWFALDRADWLEAFSHHPRIGERNLQQQRFAQTGQQSSREQSGMAVATDAQRAAFANGNAEYERRFGHVFLICATGRSAAEMLEQLNARLKNDAATELQNAATEQSRITRLRLERWLST